MIPNDTHWNSTFDSIRFIKNLIDRDSKMKQNLNSLCDFFKISKLTAQDFTFCTQFVTVKTPIAHGLDVLQGDKGNDVGAGYLLPTIVVIRDALRGFRNTEETNVSLPLVNALLAGIEKRFHDFFNLEELQLASVTNPKFKLNWLMDSDEDDLKFKKYIIAKLERKLEVMHEATLSIAQIGSCTPDDPKDFFTSLKKILPNLVRNLFGNLN